MGVLSGLKVLEGLSSKAIIETLPRTTREKLNTKSETLYHYTTPEALISILKDGRLWSSNIRFLNDAREVSYANDLVRRVTTARRKKARSALRSTLLDAVLRRWEGQALDEIYACCFCEDGDLLSQWKGYSQQGRGFAIGFDRKQIGELAQSDRCRLMKMIYKEHHQERIIGAVLDRICYVADAMKSHPTFWAAVCTHRLREFATSFKNPAFEGEREVRLIFSQQPKGPEDMQTKTKAEQKTTPSIQEKAAAEEKPVEIKFRHKAGFYVPYIEVPFRNIDPNAKTSRAITEIKVGPTIDTELARASLEYVQHHYRYTGVTVTPSSVPFRG